jgi:hypothetical protein
MNHVLPEIEIASLLPLLPHSLRIRTPYPFIVESCASVRVLSYDHDEHTLHSWIAHTSTFKEDQVSRFLQEKRINGIHATLERDSRLRENTWLLILESRTNALCTSIEETRLSHRNSVLRPHSIAGPTRCQPYASVLNDLWGLSNLHSTIYT